MGEGAIKASGGSIKIYCNRYLVDHTSGYHTHVPFGFLWVKLVIGIFLGGGEDDAHTCVDSHGSDSMLPLILMYERNIGETPSSDQAYMQGLYSFLVRCVIVPQGCQGDVEGGSFGPFAYIMQVEDRNTLIESEVKDGIFEVQTRKIHSILVLRNKTRVFALRNNPYLDSIS